MTDQHVEKPNPVDKKRTQLLLAAFVLVVLVIVIAYVMTQQGESKPQENTYVPDIVASAPEPKMIEVQEPEVVEQPMPEQQPVQQLPPKVAPEPFDTKPVEQPVKPEPLTFEQGDEGLMSKIEANASLQAAKLLASDDLIRRTVVFVDNLAKGDIAKKHSPVLEPKEKFKALDGDLAIIDPNSYERYTPYVNLVSRFSGAQLVRMYGEFEPLFKEAYQEIGYDGDNFKATLNNAIQELLDTPIPKTPIPLIKESVTYKYAYPEWEQLSDAQKQFLRMGPDNMKKLKVTLQAVQKALKENN
jgi:hypothetical protein